MRNKHPSFRFEARMQGRTTMGVWTGIVQPIRRTDELLHLLDDLFHDRPVYVVDDEVQHLPDCNSEHCRHGWMDKIKDLRMRFDLEIRHNGDCTLPRCWVLSPVIPQRKHFWADGAICAFLASDGIWVWHTHTVADFVPYTLIWLVKWMVFDQTGEWIGAEHENSPEYHFQTVKPKAQCWCGRGKQYRKCHRKEEMRALGLL